MLWILLRRSALSLGKGPNLGLDPNENSALPRLQLAMWLFRRGAEISGTALERPTVLNNRYWAFLPCGICRLSVICSCLGVVGLFYLPTCMLSLASDASETVEVISIKLGTVTAAGMGMHQVFIM